MPNIVLTRIDNRLIHGQVLTQWLTSCGANVIVVANDEVAQNEMRQSLMSMALPSSVKARFFTIEKAAEAIGKADASRKILLLCETPKDAFRLVESGTPIKEINIGNMHMEEGKHQVTTSVAVDEKDQKDLKRLMDFGVTLFIQRTPDTPKESVDKIFE